MKNKISNIHERGEFLYLCFDETIEHDDGGSAQVSYEIHPCRPTKTQWLDVDETFFTNEQIKELVRKHKSKWTREIKEKYKDMQEEIMIATIDSKNVLTQDQLDFILNGI